VPECADGYTSRVCGVFTSITLI